MHTLPALAGSAPLFTGAALLALALALGACGAPRRVELSTAPITLPSASMLATAPPSASVTGSPHPAASRSNATAGAAPPPIAAVTGRPTSPAALPLVDASCGRQPSAFAPKTILLACADGSLRLENISYSSYGPVSATGHAVMHANTCRPNCANGAFRDYPATIVLDDVAAGRFTQVTLHYYAGAGPDGRTTASYPIQ